MKAIVINGKNEERISKAIEEVQKNAHCRKLTYAGLISEIGKIERKLSGIPKKYWNGIGFQIDEFAQKYPKAYKYSAYTTFCTIEHNGKTWKLINVYSGEHGRTDKTCCMFKTTEEFDKAAAETFKNF